MRKIRLSLSGKLFLAFMLSVLIPASLLSLYSYIQSSLLMESLGTKWQINSLNQAEESISFRIDAINSQFNSVVNTSIILRLVAEGSNADNLLQQIADMHELQKIVQGVEDNSAVRKMRIYLTDAIYLSETSSILNLNALRQTDLYGEISGRAKRIHFTHAYPYEAGAPVPRNVISAFVGIKEFEYMESDSLMIEMVLDEQYFRGPLDSLTTEVESHAYLVDAKGSIVLGSAGSTPVGEAIVTEQWDRMSASDLRDWESVDYGGAVYYLGLREIKNTEWTLFYILPEAQLLSSSVQLRRSLLLAVGFCLVMMTFVVLGLSELTTARLKKLRNAMTQVQDGNFAVSLDFGGNDEIGDLKEDFLYMVSRIGELLEEKSLSVEKLRTLELDALHSQINPHFLYNSLDLVNWMAYEKGVPEIQEAVADLARFYKISLSKGEMMIPLREEIVHVTMYVKIQNLRYDDIIRFTCHLGEDLENYLIPKITLQPLVENAIVHGIMKKREKRGHIDICCHLDEEGYLAIRVEDDGVGIDPQVKKTILDGDGRVGYGLHNVNNRLRLYFGEGCGLSFPPPEQGRGCCVLVRIRPTRVYPPSDRD